MNENELILLHAIFLASALNDKLDELTVSNAFTRKFKRDTNRYLIELKQHSHKLLNNAYDVDAESFEGMDRLISMRAKQFATMTFAELGIIEAEG